MGSRDTKSPPALGFLTVVEHESYGLFGGYLLLNRSGRPLEFHCTAPVKANRAQEILYGPTLLPFLYGEQIGQTLVTKSTLEPLVICTDLAPMLTLRDHVESPVALVMPEVDPETFSPPASHRIDPKHLPAELATFRMGRNRLAVHVRRSDDERKVTDQLKELTDFFDLSEPFGRIRGAIEEAQRGGK